MENYSFTFSTCKRVQLCGHSQLDFVGIDFIKSIEASKYELASKTPGTILNDEQEEMIKFFILVNTREERNGFS